MFSVNNYSHTTKSCYKECPYFPPGEGKLLKWMFWPSIRIIVIFMR